MINDSGQRQLTSLLSSTSPWPQPPACARESVPKLPNPKTEANPGRAKGVCSHNTATRMADRGTDVREYESRYNHRDELGKDKGVRTR